MDFLSLLNLLGITPMTKGAKGAQKIQRQPMQTQSTVPVGTVDTSRAAFGVPDTAGGLISPILQGGVQQPGADFVHAAAPGQMSPQGGNGGTMLQGNGASYGATDFLQPGNPNRGNDFNSSAPAGMPFDVRHIQDLYASLFGGRRKR